MMVVNMTSEDPSDDIARQLASILFKNTLYLEVFEVSAPPT